MRSEQLTDPGLFAAYMLEAISCVTTLTSMSEEEAEEHINSLLEEGRKLEDIIDEAYKIMAL